VGLCVIQALRPCKFLFWANLRVIRDPETNEVTFYRLVILTESPSWG
jgi:hypothetical protein